MNDVELQQRLSIRSKITKVINWIAYIVLVAAIVMGAIFVYWSSQNPVVIEAKTPFAVRPKDNVAGQVQFLTIDYCKKYKAYGKVTARLVGNKSVIRIPWSNDNSPTQCLKTEIPVVIPAYAIDDTYYIEFEVVYKINPIKESDPVIMRSQPFTITASKELPN